VFVGQGFEVDQPGWVVDGDVEVVVADPAATAAFAVGVVLAPVQSPAAAVGDPAEFLHIAGVRVGLMSGREGRSSRPASSSAR
jgi:hypothetical protein